MQVLRTAAVTALSVAVLAPAAQAQAPRTGGEARGYSSWTTLSEELSFIRALEGSRVQRLVVGTSARGRAIRLVLVGPPKTAGQIAAESTALVVCGQHGNEPAGREECLTRIRQERDTGLRRTVLIMPTVNPDGRAANTRNNGTSPSLDVNRDHADAAAGGQRSPEARAVRSVLDRYDPELVLDLHEYQDSGARAILFSDRVSTDPLAHPAAVPVATELHDAAVARVRASRTATGTLFTTGTYPTDPNGIGRTLRSVGMRRGFPVLLVETPRLGALAPTSRVLAHRAAVNGALDLPLVRAGR